MRKWRAACDTGGVFAADFTDPVHARVIDLSVIGLLVLAGVVLVVTLVWWRATRGEHPSLSRLEVMGQRRYRFADDHSRHSVLERVRPSGPGDDDLVVQAVHPAANESANDADEANDEGGDLVVAEPVAADTPSPSGVEEFLHEFADLLPAEDSADQSVPSSGESPAPEVP